MGFNPSSAGGLMSLDFLALPGTVTVSDALTAVARSRGLQPEALASVHAVDTDGRLLGVARLVTLLQSDPAAELTEVCDTGPARIGPDTDVTDVAALTTDYNLTTVPVVDAGRRMLGLITVDDLLETTLPDDWRQRQAAEPPDARQGQPAWRYWSQSAWGGMVSGPPVTLPPHQIRPIRLADAGAAPPAGRCARGPGKQSRPGDGKGDLGPVLSALWTAQAADIGDERESGHIHAPDMRRWSQ
jgi:CBS domain-containing protein